VPQPKCLVNRDFAVTAELFSRSHPLLFR